MGVHHGQDADRFRSAFGVSAPSSSLGVCGLPRFALLSPGGWGREGGGRGFSPLSLCTGNAPTGELRVAGTSTLAEHFKSTLL